VDWETLPVVVADKEAASYQHAALAQLGEPWNKEKVICQLKYLAEVEHALCVKFLYAHYSIEAPLVVSHGPAKDTDDPLTKVAKEIFEIAIDEMRHFRWVNEALRLLCVPAVVTRADELIRPREGKEPERIKLGLEPLTPGELDRFIEIEKPSKRYESGQIAGLYTHILVSLEQHPDRLTEYKPDVREKLQEICKLIMDEGDGHFHRADHVKHLLDGRHPDAYLRVKGPPAPEPPGSDGAALQLLGDQYYWLMLDILRQAFAEPSDKRGRTIKQARRVMYNLHEIGHLLGGLGKGLLFTKPPPPPAGSSPASAISRALTTSIPNLLAPLRELGLKEAAAVVENQVKVVSELQQARADDPEDDGP